MQLSGSKLAGMIMVFNGRGVLGKSEFQPNPLLGMCYFLARPGIILHEIAENFTPNTGGVCH